MRKTVTHIDCPKIWESESDWDSHKNLLWLALKNTSEYVVEMGMGFGSTPIIDLECKMSNRVFYSYETNRDWYLKMIMISGKTYLIDDYLKQEIGNPEVLFVDCAPAEVRKDLIEKWKDVPIIVVHDTEEGAEYVYGLSKILSTFRYRLDYAPEGKPHTTVVSNTVNVTEWC